MLSSGDLNLHLNCILVVTFTVALRTGFGQSLLAIDADGVRGKGQRESMMLMTVLFGLLLIEVRRRRQINNNGKVIITHNIMMRLCVFQLNATVRPSCGG